MADYAYLNTSRYVLRYQNNGEEHSQTMRFEREQGVPPAGSQLESIGTFWGALAPILATDFAWLDAVWYNADQRVSVPAVVPPPVTGIPVGNSPNVSNKPNAVTFVGRSLGGSKARLMIVGVGQGGGNGVWTNYRITAGESTWFDSARLALQAIPGLVAIDNQSVIWAPKANYKPHDYWVRKVR